MKMSKRIIALSGLLLFATACGDSGVTDLQSAVNPVHGAWQAKHGMSESSYQRNFDSLQEQGYQLKNVSAFSVGGKPRFAAIWDSSTNQPTIAKHDMDSRSYQREFNRRASTGYRLVDLSGYEKDGKARFAAKWVKDNGPSFKAHHNLSRDSFEDKRRDYRYEGFKMTNVSVYNVGNSIYYAGIWERGYGHTQIIQTDLNFTEATALYQTPGYEVIDISGYQADGGFPFERNRFTMILNRGAADQEVFLGNDASTYQANFRRMTLENRRLVHIAGYTLDGVARYSAVFE